MGAVVDGRLEARYDAVVNKVKRDFEESPLWAGIGEALVVGGGLDAEPAGQHDGVGRGPRIGQRMGDEFQARTGPHGCAFDRDEADVVPLIGAQQLGSAGEDVEWADDVEGLHAWIGEDHDRPSHVLNRGPRRPWRPRRGSHRSGHG